MPIYEYVCKSCGHEKEVLQGLKEAVLTECPACGKPDFIKKISAPGFRLKGGGWYETDFKTGNKKNIAGSKESDSKPAEKSDKGKTEPAAPKAPKAASAAGAESKS